VTSGQELLKEVFAIPELPEVETIRKGLEKYLVGHKILAVRVNVAKIFPSGKEKLIGAKIKGTRRFGKVLVVDLNNGYSFMVHLKLTGQLVFSSSRLLNQPNKFTHVIFELDGGAKLFFNDSRKFGWIKVVETDKVTEKGFVGKLGPEPFRDLTLEKFEEVVSKSKRPIKITLMDQEKIAGVGNIYANDALWLAKINPKKTANSLSLNEQSILYKAMLRVLKDGLKYQGASDQWYITAEGRKGAYQEHFLVYGQDGKTCPRCKKEKIKKFFLGGRGTYYCPRCQR
jgi:formamidopyrimidine-DNA glycosylase